ncbi:hypothetical protein [Desulfobacula sp.]|uniref:hypothetical protein n=1 Tax=Desulfobacula sp. TaxID=2593537 RepID=UPI002603C7A4|nr:hypothetical protein [Desulfobacula sp.]
MKKLVMIFLLCFWSTTLVMASDSADDLSKKANKMIRNAERNYYSRKVTDADELLKQAKQLLEEVKAADPGHKSLKSLQNKYNRTRKLVDKKLGTKSAGTATSAAPASSTSGPKPLSHGARSNLKLAYGEMDFAQSEMDQGEKALKANKTNLVKSYSFNAEQKLNGAQSLLDRVVKNNKADPNNPDVAAGVKRLKEMQAKFAVFKQKAENQNNQMVAAKASAKADAEAMNQTWLPRIKTYIDYEGAKRLQFPGLRNKEALEKQDRYFKEAQTLLANFEKQTSAKELTHELSQASSDLKFKIEIYENDRNAEARNMAGPVKRTLDEWSQRFEQNKTWKPESGTYLFVLSQKKINYQKEQIKKMSDTLQDQAAQFSEQLSKLEKQNKAWYQKKEEWANRPQPFPAAGMVNKSLVNQLTGFLKDRGIKPDKINILDKDWWVLKGEYRYMKAAFMSKDKKGKFWSAFNFRQMQTLTGYGPTELWEINERQIRLP